VESAPVVDGSVDDPAWAAATWRTVPMEGEAGPHEARVAAVVHGETLTMAFRWADPTEDRVHKPWVRTADRTWAAGPQREDVLAVGFPISGEFTGIMTSPVECVWDVWHWKAGRTDPAGFAMDRRHVHTLADPGTRGFSMDLPGGGKLHIRRPEDAGDSVTRSLKPPAGDADAAPQYEAVAPTGSAADVRAKGRWRNGEWTVEISRALRTGHDDDAGFSRGASVPFAFAILDHAEDEQHVSSPRLELVVE
jgi:DMSO reductase family type II enzyme heme b subunit